MLPWLGVESLKSVWLTQRRLESRILGLSLVFRASATVLVNTPLFVFVNSPVTRSTHPLGRRIADFKKERTLTRNNTTL